MRARKQKFDRLLSALDDLVTQEAMTVKAGDYAAVGDIQRRADPLVSMIATLGPEVDDAMARARVAALLARRQHNIDFIEAQLATARDELEAVQESIRRMAKMAPVYGRAENAGKKPRFNAAG